MSLKKRKLVVLDLDNTCICAKEKHEIRTVANSDFYTGVHAPVDLLDDDNETIIYRIYPRPRLQEFLDQLFEEYRVAVWTAADLDYALFVIQHFITPVGFPNRHLEFIMWGEHCEYSSEKTKRTRQAKQLTLLSLPKDHPLFDINDTVLIDDNREVLRQLEDTIDSQYFDVSNPEAIHDLFFPHTCLQKIKHHVNNYERRLHSDLKNQKI
jgi:hypothetical protein